MVYAHIQPSEHLRAFVREYTVLHFRFGPADPVAVKPFPAPPTQGLTFYPRGFLTARSPAAGTATRRPRAVVYGQQLTRLDLALCPDEYLMVDVQFQPGVLAKFLRQPLLAFVDRNVDAEAVLGPEVHRLTDRLANATDYAQLVPLLEAYLGPRLRAVGVALRPIDHVSRLMRQAPRPASLATWAGHACLSPSQFERLFRQQMGVSPKLYARIVRFDHAFHLKETTPALDWLSVALHAGYHDYQHLVKDFQQFAGATPPRLLADNAQAPEKWLGLG